MCTSIATLYGQHKEKTCKSGSYSTNLTPKEKMKVAELIAHNFLIQCRRNQRETSVLLDTGSQVSIISEDYLQQNHLDTEIKHISHVPDEPDSVRVPWGNNADIPFNSFTVMQLNVGDEGVSCHVDVPFLFTSDHIHHSVVGFNTIRHISKESSDVNFFNKLFEKTFNNTHISKIDAFVNLIQSQEQEKVVVKLKGKDCIISPGSSVQVASKTNVGCLTSPQPMIFQQGELELPEGLECTDSVIMLKPGAKSYFQIPVSNSSNHDMAEEQNTSTR